MNIAKIRPMTIDHEFTTVQPHLIFSAMITSPKWGFGMTLSKQSLRIALFTVHFCWNWGTHDHH